MINNDKNINDFKIALHKGMIVNYKRDGFITPIIFFMTVKKQGFVQAIPPEFLKTSEGKSKLSTFIKQICSDLSVIAAGIMIEAYAKSVEKDNELGDLLQKGNVKVSELKEKDDIILMIFSTPKFEEIIGYYVNPETKEVKTKLENSSEIGGIFSQLFDWRKAKMN
jgi:hypothetical protein